MWEMMADLSKMMGDKQNSQPERMLDNGRRILSPHSQMPMGTSPNPCQCWPIAMQDVPPLWSVVTSIDTNQESNSGTGASVLMPRISIGFLIEETLGAKEVEPH
jgi:hypothetical protein